MIPLSTTVEVFDTASPLVTKVVAFNTKKGFTSLSHAWSAHPLFHLMNILGGVIQEKVAWGNVTYKPYFDASLSQVHIVMPCPAGLIESPWVRKYDGIHVKLNLPLGVSATVLIPGYETDTEGTYESIIVE